MQAKTGKGEDADAEDGEDADVEGREDDGEDDEDDDEEVALQYSAKQAKKGKVVCTFVFL